MEFIKAQANGNDFIIVGKDDYAEADASLLCDRHYGIGADGVLLWEKRDKGYFMEIINADGTKSNICVNGLRVLGKYLMDIEKSRCIEIFTQAGRAVVERHGRDIDAVVGLLCRASEERRLVIEEREFDISYYHLNNHHGLYFGKWEEGDFYRYAGRLQEVLKANISFVKKTGDGRYYAMVWERGAGFTLSCGSAAMAVFYHLEKRFGEESACIEMPGGLFMLFREKEGVRIRGGAEVVFSGRIKEEGHGI